MKKLFLCALMALLTTGVAFAGGEEMSAEAVFERLKAMEGTWKSDSVAGHGEHVFQTSANGTVVMETMAPGTPHEMINMYHLDGEDLVLTHYCAAGNQPTMKLAGSEDGAYTFEFTGGTNLDPATDTHIHEAQLAFEGDDKVLSTWVGFSGGERAEAMEFTLTRGQ